MVNNSNDTKDSGLLAWSLLLFLSLVWGSSFILIKKALIAFDPLQVGTGRIVFAFLAFLPFLPRMLQQVKKKDLLPLLIVGICGSGLPALFYAKAQTDISSSIAGLLNALTPIFTLLLAVSVFGGKTKSKQLIGIILGFLGTLFIFLSKDESSSHFPYLMGMLIVLATLCYGISANTIGAKLRGVKPLVISTISFSMIGLFACAYLFSTDFIYQVSNHNDGMTSLLALLVLSLIGTFLANILFFKLIQITDPVFSSSVSFITPIVAMMWGFLDGESFHLYFFVALILIFSGVFLVKYADK